MENDADDSEVVGMPTTWEYLDVPPNSWTLPRFCVVCHRAVPATERRRVGDLSGHLPCVEYPHRYVTLAPTSRN